MPIKVYIFENTHYIETSYLISTFVYVNLSKYRFLRCYEKFLHFSRAEKEKNIFLAWNWVDILRKWDITLFTNCFLLLIAHCHLLFLMTHGTTLSTAQQKRAGRSAQWPNWKRHSRLILLVVQCRQSLPGFFFCWFSENAAG